MDFGPVKTFLIHLGHDGAWQLPSQWQLLGGNMRGRCGECLPPEFTPDLPAKE